jgi:membrane associated rhomboid family serine protease
MSFASIPTRARCAVSTSATFLSDTRIVSPGARGAIAAVMGAFLVTFPQDRIRSLLVIFVFVRVAYVPAVLLIGVWGLIQFLSLGAISQQPSGGGVAYAAHVGGFIFGTVAARLFTRGGNDPKLELAR